MSEVLELEDEVLEDDVDNMGSLNHSLIQGKITTLLSNDDKYVAMPELSLDASQIDLSQFGLKTKEELKPDVCVYSGHYCNAVMMTY